MTDFNPNLPAGTQNISAGQGSIQNNFFQQDEIFDNDHYTFDDSTDGGAFRGFHRQVTFPLHISAPSPVDDEAVVYTTDVSSLPQLTFANSAGATILTGLAKSIMTSGYYTLPGGLIIQWAPVTGAANNTTVTFPLTFPNNFFSVSLAGGLAAGTQPTININPTSVSTTGFVLKITGTTPVNLFYIAIGN